MSWFFCIVALQKFLFAQDNLAVIELTEVGESIPVSFPAGTAFTFSLFAPSSSPSSAVGVVRYGAPVSITHEVKNEMVPSPANSPWPWEGWFLGPATVSLRGEIKGARMQLFSIKLPRGTVSGILSESAPAQTVDVGKDVALTPLFDFCVRRPFNTFQSDSVKFHCDLSIKSPTGATFSRLQIPFYGSAFFSPTPAVRGGANLNSVTFPTSSVTKGMRYAELSQMSPTADFIGPGVATVSLPAENSPRVAFYCFKLTPVKAARISTQLRK